MAAHPPRNILATTGFGSTSGSAWAFGYQAIVGARYEITPVIALDVDYRYLATAGFTLTGTCPFTHRAVPRLRRPHARAEERLQHEQLRRQLDGIGNGSGRARPGGGNGKVARIGSGREVGPSSLGPEIKCDGRKRAEHIPLRVRPGGCQYHTKRHSGADETAIYHSITSAADTRVSLSSCGFIMQNRISQVNIWSLGKLASNRTLRSFGLTASVCTPDSGRASVWERPRAGCLGVT